MGSYRGAVVGGAASLTHPPCSGSTLWTVGSGSALRRTATTHTPHDAGGTTADPCSWRWMARAFPGRAGAHDGTNCPHTSCQCWSRPEGPADGSGGMGGTEGLQDLELDSKGPRLGRDPTGCLLAARHGDRTGSLQARPTLRIHKPGSFRPI